MFKQLSNILKTVCKKTIPRLHLVVACRGKLDGRSRTHPSTRNGDHGMEAAVSLLAW